jgi:hypothetical protein
MHWRLRLADSAFRRPPSALTSSLVPAPLLPTCRALLRPAALIVLFSIAVAKIH